MKKGGYLYKLPILFANPTDTEKLEIKKKELNNLGIWGSTEDTGENEFTSKTFSLITIFNEKILTFIKCFI